MKKMILKKKKIIIAFSALGCGIIALLSGVLIGSSNKALAQNAVFGKANKVTVTTDASAKDDLSGRKGVCLSASDNGASIEFNGEMSGVFEPEFRAYSAVTGVQDFGGIEFAFVSTETRLGFSLDITSDMRGVSMTYELSNNSVVSKTVAIEGSFCNLDKQPISFKFNPTEMTVADDKGVVFVDMQNLAFMKEFLCDTTLPSWEKYAVTVTFKNIIEDKTANVLFYSINGQELSGRTFSNTASAIFVTEPSAKKGVVGREYILPTEIVSYDVLDGYKNAFQGATEVFDPKGNSVAVNGGKFTPTATGDYRICYTLKDDDNLMGEKREYTVRVYETAPAVSITYDVPMEENEIGVGSTVYLPKARGYSDLAEETLPVLVEVFDGVNKTVVKEGKYTFTNTGVYKVIYTCKDSAGTVTTEETQSTVLDIPTQSAIGLTVDYAFGDVFSVPNAKFEKDGNVYEAKHTITYPDGSSTEAQSVTLTQLGLYNLTWRFDYQGQTYQRTKYFNAVQNPKNLFEKTSGLSVTENYTAPSYADEAYNGVLLTARQPLQTTFVNTFDISDNTKDDTLIEFFFSPTEAGTREFEQLDIYFYDVHDESNFIHIHFVDDPWLYFKFATSVIATTTGSFDVSKDALFRKYYYSHLVYSTFYGKDTSGGDYPSQSVRLSFDYESGKLYANTVASSANIAEKKMATSYMIADLKDESWVGAGNAFEAFTTGETRMVIKMSALKTTANMMVLNIDGQSFAGSVLQDDVAPTIFVDYDGNDADNVPLGEVGKEYKIYRAYLQDVVGGCIENVSAEVYYLGETREKIRSANRSFTPEKTGTYEIVYEGYDVSGNYTTKTVLVNVVGVGEIPEITYMFAEMENSLQQGETARFYEGKAGGGTGKLYVDVKVKFGENEISMDEDGCFKVTEAGEYKIEVRVSDYNGTSEPFIYVIEVAATVKPLIYESTVNSVVRAGEQIVLPAFRAVTYDGNVEQEAEIKYFIDGKELPADRSWTPEKDVEKTYVFKVQSGASEKEYTIYATSSKGENKSYATSFFHSTNGSISASRVATEFTTAEPTLNVISFARKIDVNFLDFALSVASENYNKIVATLTDSENPQERVEIALRRGVNTNGATNRAFCLVNGREYEMRGEFSNTTIPLYIAYDKNGHTLSDDVGNGIGKIYKTVDGKAFNGFSSGFVYINFRVENVTDTESVQLNLLSISGQKFNSTIRSDKNGPMIKIAGESGEINIGDTVTVYPAIAFDLLSGVNSISVSVMANGKSLVANVACDKPFTFNVDAYGTYLITYTAYDTLGNENSTFASISVADRVPPSLTLQGGIPEGVKVNGTYKLPGATVTDDHSVTTLYVYAIAPDGEMILLTDYQFNPKQTGKYKIIYLASDEEGSSTIETFDVWVVK